MDSDQLLALTNVANCASNQNAVPIVASCLTCGVSLQVWHPSATEMKELRAVTAIRSPHGRVWGATLYNLYLVPRNQEVHDYVTENAVQSPLCRVRILNVKGLDALDPQDGDHDFMIWSSSMIERFKFKLSHISDSVLDDLSNENGHHERPSIKNPFALIQEQQFINPKSCEVKNTEARSETKVPPKLEVDISDQQLPHFLLVNDSAGFVEGTYTKWRSGVPRIVKYVQKWPVDYTHASSDAEKQAEIAALFLNPSTHHDEGNHSHVYKATIKFPSVKPNLRSNDGQVTVVCKIAQPDKKAWEMLAHEARIYDELGKSASHLHHEFTGLNAMEGRMVPTALHAVIPKFYGYYVPIKDEIDHPTHHSGEIGEPSRDGHSDDLEKFCRMVAEERGDLVFGPSPILFMEECGNFVNTRQLSRVQRHDIVALFRHLHRAGYVHNSPYERNVLIQPGPLSKPPAERSMSNASLRLVDLGRAKSCAVNKIERDIENWRAFREFRLCSKIKANAAIKRLQGEVYEKGDARA